MGECFRSFLQAFSDAQPTAIKHWRKIFTVHLLQNWSWSTYKLVLAFFTAYIPHKMHRCQIITNRYPTFFALSSSTFTCSTCCVFLCLTSCSCTSRLFTSSSRAFLSWITSCSRLLRTSCCAAVWSSESSSSLFKASSSYNHQSALHTISVKIYAV